MSEMSNTITHQAARTSWMAPLVAIIFVTVSRNIADVSRAKNLIVGGVAFLFYIAGLIAAIYALATMKRVGKKGVLIPASIGLLVNGALVVVFTLLIVSALLS